MGRQKKILPHVALGQTHTPLLQHSYRGPRIPQKNFKETMELDGYNPVVLQLKILLAVFLIVAGVCYLAYKTSWNETQPVSENEETSQSPGAQAAPAGTPTPPPAEGL